MADDRRAQQIAAVRDILGWDAESIDDYGNAIDPLAARIVDAVEAVPPPLAIALRNDLEIMRAELAEAHAEHHQACIDRDERLTLEESSTLAKMVDDLRAQLDLAHAAGYAAAVAALRDDQAHERWGDTNGRAIWGSPIRDNLADYLEAVGSGTQPADPQPADEEWTLAQVMDGARGREER